MKPVALLLISMTLGLATAHAEDDAIFTALQSRFEAAKGVPAISDFPTYENRQSLTCTLASRQSHQTNAGGIFLVSKMTGNDAGPIFNPTTETKLFLGIVPPGLGYDAILQVFNLITVESRTDGLIVKVAETSDYVGSPVEYTIRKSDYIYLKANETAENFISYGYCYPSSN